MQMTAPIAPISAEEIETVKSVINAIQSNRRAAEERAKQIEKSRNELLARDLEARKAAAAKRPCLADRIWDRIVRAYSVVYAIVFLISDSLVKIDDEA
jgi:hypothetical protein